MNYVKLMLILHTSDLHLNPNQPETLEALQCILDTCKAQSVNLLTIGGDLFNQARDVEVLRPKLRQAFSGNDFKVIAIPGNHDIEAYNRNLDFGEDIRMITKRPFDIISFDTVSIVSIPFTENLTDELVVELEKAVNPDKVNILLLHCTLDLSYENLDFGEEERKSYFSISSSLLSKFGYDFILAGHFHKDYYRKNLEGGSIFIYPGSPLSLTRKEIGQRRVALIDTNAGTISSIQLDTPFYDKCRALVRPGSEAETLSNIQRWIQERSGKSCKYLIEVSGFGEMDEIEFRESLHEIAPSAELYNEYKNVENVLSHVLFRRFKEKLEEKEDISQKETLEDRVIEVMSEMLAERKIR